MLINKLHTISDILQDCRLFYTTELSLFDVNTASEKILLLRDLLSKFSSCPILPPSAVVRAISESAIRRSEVHPHIRRLLPSVSQRLLLAKRESPHAAAAYQAAVDMWKAKNYNLLLTEQCALNVIAYLSTDGNERGCYHEFIEMIMHSTYEILAKDEKLDARLYKATIVPSIQLIAKMLVSTRLNSRHHRRHAIFILKRVAFHCEQLAQESIPLSVVESVVSTFIKLMYTDSDLREPIAEALFMYIERSNAIESRVRTCLCVRGH